MMGLTKNRITPVNDPWEAYRDVEEFGRVTLSNIEVTTTTLCNMRCEHCAVGYTLRPKDPDALPLEVLLHRLEALPHLRAFSITGGEPMMSQKSVRDYVLPLLRYAHGRGARTQINSNLTMPLERYEAILPYLDVLHISHNYGSVEDFSDIGFAMAERKPGEKQRQAMFARMIDNAKALTSRGVMVSAETMLNKRTLPHLEQIHEQIVEMGCQRHEVHPMYPSDFASALEVTSLPTIREGIHRLLDCRSPEIWMLFGTLPFYPCSTNEEDLRLQKRLYNEKNVTVRNDPDGRSRLNVNIFTGDIIVTDFGDTPELGNIQSTSFEEAYEKWKASAINDSLSCHCPEVKCLGPNVLVKDTYYKAVDFRKRSSNL
ncbi:radical SAM/CxCxxxxC motif protein YfkAB [Shouchella shacheensis]|uniref:radical SAM/CxCxxxxC motif protein YfkAB n=1 Tax=Shouchella shacheensis TaxID=1649580 RepID=UPI000740571D|nr:radical SAM/CxCxxxxC motif protein YfkAB [Shouchella shacheensis]